MYGQMRISLRQACHSRRCGIRSSIRKRQRAVQRAGTSGAKCKSSINGWAVCLDGVFAEQSHRHCQHVHPHSDQGDCSNTDKKYCLPQQQLASHITFVTRTLSSKGLCVLPSRIKLFYLPSLGPVCSAPYSCHLFYFVSENPKKNDVAHIFLFHYFCLQCLICNVNQNYDSDIA